MPTECHSIIEIRRGVEFLDEILEAGGVHAWNSWVRSISTSLDWNPLSPGWLEGEEEPRIQIDLNFAGADLSGRQLDGINLEFVWLDATCFDGCSLRGARLVSLPHATFRAADLTGANLGWAEITATDFSQARIDRLNLDHSMFDPDEPPVGLPKSLIQRLHRVRLGQMR
jgi:hypothetical protein